MRKGAGSGKNVTGTKSLLHYVFPPKTHGDEWKMVTEGFDMLGGEEYEEKDGWSLGIK